MACRYQERWGKPWGRRKARSAARRAALRGAGLEGEAGLARDAVFCTFLIAATACMRRRAASPAEGTPRCWRKTVKSEPLPKSPTDTSVPEISLTELSLAESSLIELALFAPGAGPVASGVGAEVEGLNFSPDLSQTS